MPHYAESPEGATSTIWGRVNTFTNPMSPLRGFEILSYHASVGPGYTPRPLRGRRKDWNRIMKRYAIVIEKAPSNYGAYVPDLPECVATGATVQEAESL